MIGAAASVLLLFLGRIAGVSGILAGVLRSEPDGGWRWAFLAGLPLGVLAFVAAGGAAPVEVASTPATMVVGGLLVGFGTRLGNGCTSGHGVCGLARGSRRSVTATLVFMTTAAATVFLARHVL